MHELSLKRYQSSDHILSAYDFKQPGRSTKIRKRPLKIGQWVFDVSTDDLGWQPLSAGLCSSGMIALYPVRKIDLFVKDYAIMHSIIGIQRMRPKMHYFLIGETGLTGLNWKALVIDKK
ncbi:MAG: hypothetical protein J6N72_05435 [Psychrobacter sp.]|nr:hypothetical protein [Psychrobacter sp.]